MTSTKLYQHYLLDHAYMFGIWPNNVPFQWHYDNNLVVTAEASYHTKMSVNSAYYTVANQVFQKGG